MKKALLLSVFHSAVRADPLATNWLAPSAADIEKTLNDFRNAQPDKDDLPEYKTLEDVKQAVGYGQHWTGFSNAYGGCTDTVDAIEDDQPVTRYLPFTSENACLIRKCNKVSKNYQRYRVCTLPDHPDVVSSARSGPTNIVEKLKRTDGRGSDGKMARIYEHLGSLDMERNYSDIYNDMMKTDFRTFTPARGWPDALSLQDSGQDCTGGELDVFKANTNRGGTAMTVEGPKTSFCVFNEAMGIFEGCSNQLLHSVNARCDPRMWFYAMAIMDKNAGLNHTDILDELEKAHFHNDGKVKFGDDSVVQVTGEKAESALIPESYLIAHKEERGCSRQCPVPMPWTSWTCHCGTTVNTDGLAACCGDTRRRFRGCFDTECRQDATCGGLSKAVSSSTYGNNQLYKDLDRTLYSNCATINTDQTCNAVTDNWWTNNWNKVPRTVQKISGFTKANAMIEIIKTWNNKGLLTKYGLDEAGAEAFMTLYPTADLANLESIVGNCDLVGTGDFNDRFTNCLISTLSGTDLFNAAAASNTFKFFLINKAMDASYISGGVVNYNVLFPTGKWEPTVGASVGPTGPLRVAVEIQNILNERVGKGVAIEDINELVFGGMLSDLVRWVQEKNLGARPDFPRTRPGAALVINVDSLVNVNAIINDDYYKKNLQNIWANDKSSGAPGLGRDGTALPRTEYTGNRFLDTTPDPDVCVSHSYGLNDEFVQCNVAESATNANGLAGYTRDNEQRHEWTISGNELSLKTYDNKQEEFIDLSDALLAWYESLSCMGEIAYEDEICPERPRLRPDTSDDTCVSGFQDAAAVKCQGGFKKSSLIIHVDGLPAPTLFKLYWNQATKTWGNPHVDNYDSTSTDDGEFDAATGIFTVSADYLTRKAIYDAADLNECGFNPPDPVACKNPCEYTQWSAWGEWDVNNNADLVSDSGADGFVDQSLPANTFAWFQARNDIGSMSAGNHHCFRVFETKESFANVDKFIKQALVVAKDGNSNADQVAFALRFIQSWLRDGLYMDRDKATSVAFIANVDTYLADVAAGDITLLDLEKMSFVNPGVNYNFDENRYEYIHGMGKAGTVLDGSEGWQLDILKAGWMTPNSGYSPHGWRFSCRDRNDDTVKGYRARVRDPDCGSAIEPDCCGQVHLEECELPICPDWTLWTEYSECSKSCFDEPKLNPGYGYKIRGRNCEAHTDLLNAAGTAVNIQLPEKLYKGCVCATNSQTEDATGCQTSENIAATSNQCTWQMAKCNTNKPCPKEGGSVLVKSCPACGSGHKEIKQKLCTGPGAAGADWDSAEPYTADHCKFPDGEFKTEDCTDVVCTAASVSGNCVNNIREIIVNGEIEQESCSIVAWSDWTSCPVVTCAERPIGKSFRFSAQAETEHKDCPVSTLACPKWSDWSEWSECAENSKSRSRDCINPNNLTPIGGECFGESTETCAC